MMMNLIIKHETNKILKKNTHESLITLARQEALPFILSLPVLLFVSILIKKIKRTS